MTTFAVAVFPDERSAYEGAAAFKDLHHTGIISVYETVVAQRESDGRIRSMHRDKKRVHRITGLDALLGGLLGALAGPYAAAGGVVAGGVIGRVIGFAHVQVSDDLIAEIAKDLEAGKFAVVVEISERWTSPLDERIEELGGCLRRENRRDVFEDFIDKKLRDLSDGGARRDARAARDRIRGVARAAQRQLRHIKQDLRVKIAILKKQAKYADPDEKSHIEARMAELRDDATRREKKLENACERADEALQSGSSLETSS